MTAPEMTPMIGPKQAIISRGGSGMGWFCIIAASRG